MTSGSGCFKTAPGWGLQMTGQNRHHSSAAWCAPKKNRHTHAKIKNWPALRENHGYISSSNDIWNKGQRVQIEYGEGMGEGEAQIRWQMREVKAN